MPHRFLSVEEVAAYLHLECADVNLLVRRGEIPHEKVGSRVSFRRIDLDAWASKRLLGMSTQEIRLFHQSSSAKQHDLSARHALVPELMRPGFIEPELGAKTRSSVLRSMVALADSTGLLLCREDLLAGVIAREEQASTAMSGGVALLHPPHHDPYMFDDTFIVLGRSLSPLPFGHPDGRTSDLFFLICSQDDQIHLHLLARIAMMCYHTDLLTALREAPDRNSMYDVLLRSEEEVIASHS